MKIKIITSPFKCFFILVFLTVFLPTTTFAQSINAPTFNAPNSGSLATSICANNLFYQNASADFTFSGIASGNTFIVELSSNTGSFAAATQLGSATVIASSTVGKIFFDWPTTLSGSAYRLRIRCTSLSITGANGPAFQGYYKLFNTGFWINGKASAITICGSGSLTLSIDANTIPDPSPVQYPTLKYRWYRNSVLIPGEILSSINVSTAGVYYVEIDYGTICSSTTTDSQLVTVSIGGAAGSFPISSSNGSTICETSSTILSVTSGYNYQWFKDSVLIPTATASSYTTNQAGNYTVVVDQGGCSSTSNVFTLSLQEITASIDIAATVIIPEDTTQLVNVTTNAVSPTYQWFLNSVLISTAITNSYTATEPGDYKVIVTQTVGCTTSKELPFTIKYGINATKIPNLISPNDDGINDYWNIPLEYSNDSTEVMIINSRGDLALQTKNYQNDWPQTKLEFTTVSPIYYYVISKDGNPIKKGSITIIK